MTVLWLILWYFNDTPPISFSGSWSNWTIALVVCIVIDILGALKRTD